MADIFLSYANVDLLRVQPLIQALQQHGWSVWWDQTLLPGQTYSRVIQKALDEARCVIVVWSEASIERPWVWDEATNGQNRSILIPAMIDEVRAPLGFGSIQAARLNGWQGELDHPGFSRLIQGVTALIGSPTPEVDELEVESDIPDTAEELPPIIPVQLEAPEPIRPEPVEPEPIESQPIQHHRTAPGVSKQLFISGAVVVVVAVLAYFYFVRPEPKTITNSIGMTFALIPAGKFQMGSEGPNADEDENPVHPVRISQAFYLGTTEVTQEHWKAIMGKDNNPSDFKGDDLPVETVSWNDTQKFVRQLNAKEGGGKYRLPTEAEWAYAARAGTTTAYSFGDDASELGKYAWYDVNSGGKTHPVGQLKANGWGLHDMHGNVWEWVQDWYGRYTAATAGDPAVDPTGPAEGAYRVLRGGGWADLARYCRSSGRYRFDPGRRLPFVGFRVLRAVE